MKKEELIKLKQQLTDKLQKEKKYAPGFSLVVLNDEYVEELEKKPILLTEEEIKQKDQTKEAIIYIEKTITEYLNNLITEGYEVNRIFLGMLPVCFLSEKYYKKAFLEIKQTNNVESFPLPSDILNDYAYIEFAIRGIVNIYNPIKKCIEESGTNNLGIDSEYSCQKQFIVNYNEFNKKIEELGYDIEYKYAINRPGFDVLKENTLSKYYGRDNFYEIKIDLNQERKKEYNAIKH